MHELSLCRSIMDIVQQHLTERIGSKVTKIGVTIGELLAIDQAALSFSFEVITRNTPAEGAILDIVVIAGRANCEFCQQDVAIKRYFDVCPGCSNHLLLITDGEQLRVNYMEID